MHLDKPLVDLSEEKLRHAFVANLFDLFRAMSRLPNAELEETPTLSRHFAPPFNPMFKGAWQTQLPNDPQADIGETIEWFKTRKAPFFFWWLESEATPSDMAPRLQAHGLTAWEENAPGMVANLEDLKYALMKNTPKGYAQERVVDLSGLLDFKQAFVDGFGVPEWAGQAWVDATLQFGIEQAPWQCYVGRLNGKPIASNILFNGAGVASVFGVATSPDARGQGIGSAITLLAYYDALQMGYRYGVLFASELGVPVYRRIGFRSVDVQISRYLWRSS